MISWHVWSSRSQTWAQEIPQRDTDRQQKLTRSRNSETLKLENVVSRTLPMLFAHDDNENRESPVSPMFTDENSMAMLLKNDPQHHGHQTQMHSNREIPMNYKTCWSWWPNLRSKNWSDRKYKKLCYWVACKQGWSENTEAGMVLLSQKVHLEGPLFFKVLCYSWSSQ